MAKKLDLFLHDDENKYKKQQTKSPASAYRGTAARQSARKRDDNVDAFRESTSRGKAASQSTRKRTDNLSKPTVTELLTFQELDMHKDDPKTNSESSKANREILGINDNQKSELLPEPKTVDEYVSDVVNKRIKGVTERPGYQPRQRRQSATELMALVAPTEHPGPVQKPDTFATEYEIYKRAFAEFMTPERKERFSRPNTSVTQKEQEIYDEFNNILLAKRTDYEEHLNSKETSKIVSDVKKNADYEEKVAEGKKRTAPLNGASHEEGFEVLKYMSEDEKNTYFYLHATDTAKAIEFSQLFNIRMNKAKEQEAFEYGKAHPVLGGLKRAAYTVPTAVTSAIYAGHNAFNAATGKKAVNPYAQGYMTANLEKDQYVEGIKENTPLWGDLLIDAGFSIVDSGQAAVINAVAPGLGTAMLASSGAGSSMIDTYKRGGTAGQVALIGIGTGLIEYATESISLSHFDDLLKGKSRAEGVSFLQRLLKTADADSNLMKGFKALTYGIASQAGEEAKEELISSYANTLWDCFVMQDNSEINLMAEAYMKEGMTRADAYKTVALDKFLKEPLISAAMGGLTGGLMGGGAAAFNLGRAVIGSPRAGSVQYDGTVPGASIATRYITTEEAMNLLQKGGVKVSKSQAEILKKHHNRRAKLAHFIARAFGVNVQFGGVEKGALAQYDRSSNTIFLNPSEKVSVMKELAEGHALLHALEQTKNYEQLSDLVVNNIFGGTESNKYLSEAARIDALYKRMGQQLTEAELRQEIVAEYFRTKVFKNAKNLQQFITDNYKTLGQSFIESLKQTAAKVQQVFGKTTEAETPSISQQVLDSLAVSMNQARTKPLSDRLDAVAEGYGLLDRSTVDKVANNRYNNDAKFLFAGKHSATSDTSLLEKAKKYEAEGKTKEEILKETGWFHGKDGEWRYEIDDSKAYVENIYPGIRNAKLGDIFKHDGLYEAYPQLKDMPVEFMASSDADVLGETDGDVIHIFTSNLDFSDESSLNSSLKEVFIHEIQHTIQHIEGFETGGNTRTALSYIRKRAREYLEKTNDVGYNSALAKGTSLKYIDEFLKKEYGKDDINKIADKVYRDFYGERESQKTAERLNLTAEERISNYPRYKKPIYLKNENGGEGSAIQSGMGRYFETSRMEEEFQRGHTEKNEGALGRGTNPSGRRNASIYEENDGGSTKKIDGTERLNSKSSVKELEETNKLRSPSEDMTDDEVRNSVGAAIMHGFEERLDSLQKEIEEGKRIINDAEDFKRSYISDEELEKMFTAEEAAIKAEIHALSNMYKQEGKNISTKELAEEVSSKNAATLLMNLDTRKQDALRKAADEAQRRSVSRAIHAGYEKLFEETAFDLDDSVAEIDIAKLSDENYARSAAGSLARALSSYDRISRMRLKLQKKHIIDKTSAEQKVLKRLLNGEIDVDEIPPRFDQDRIIANFVAEKNYSEASEKISKIKQALRKRYDDKASEIFGELKDSKDLKRGWYSYFLWNPDRVFEHFANGNKEAYQKYVDTIILPNEEHNAKANRYLADLYSRISKLDISTEVEGRTNAPDSEIIKRFKTNAETTIEFLEKKINDRTAYAKRKKGFKANEKVDVSQLDSEEQTIIKEFQKKLEEIRSDVTKVSNGEFTNKAVSEDAGIQFIGEFDGQLEWLEKKLKHLQSKKDKTADDRRQIYRLEMKQAETMYEYEKFVLNNPQFGDFKEIRSKASEFRKLYDELFARLNVTYAIHGRTPLSKRAGYFYHYSNTDPTFFYEVFGFGGEDTKGLPAEIFGLTGDRSPGIRYAPFAQHRTGDKALEYSALKGFQQYAERATDIIYKTEDVQMYRAMERFLRNRGTDDEKVRRIQDIYLDKNMTVEAKEQAVREIRGESNTKFSNMVEFLHEQGNILAGKKSRLDRATEVVMNESTGEITEKRPFAKLNNATSRNAINALGYNLSTALTNYSALNYCAADVDAHSFMLAGKDMASFKSSEKFFRGHEKDNLKSESNFLTAREDVKKLRQTKIEKGAENGMWLMGVTDACVSEWVTRAYYYQAVNKLGMSGKEAMNYADLKAARCIGGRSKGSMPLAFYSKNPLIKALTMFQLEQNNILQMYADHFKGDSLKEKVLGFTIFALRAAIGEWLFNDFYEKFFGRQSLLPDVGSKAVDTVSFMFGKKLNNVFDVIDYGMKGHGWELFSDKDKVFWLESIAETGKDLASSLPYVGNLFGGNRVATLTWLPDADNVIPTLKSDHLTASEKAKTLAHDLLLTPAASLVSPVGGGGQLKKSVQGAMALLDGGRYKTGTDGKRKLAYPVDANRGNVAKGLLFGRSAVDEARKWGDRGYSYLPEPATNVYDEVVKKGVDKNKAFETVYNVNKTDAVKDDKGLRVTSRSGARRELLLNSDLPADVKSYIDQNLIQQGDKKKTVDYSQPEMVRAIEKYRDYTKDDDGKSNFEHFSEGLSDRQKKSLSVTAESTKGSLARRMALLNDDTLTPEQKNKFDAEWLSEISEQKPSKEHYEKMMKSEPGFTCDYETYERIHKLISEQPTRNQALGVLVSPPGKDPVPLELAVKIYRAFDLKKAHDYRDEDRFYASEMPLSQREKCVDIMQQFGLSTAGHVYYFNKVMNSGGSKKKQKIQALVDIGFTQAQAEAYYKAVN